MWDARAVARCGVVALLARLALASFTTDAYAGLGDCAQPSTHGAAPKASDCLFVLRAAVGNETCAPSCICDVNGNSSLSAIDGLACLRVAVGVAGATLDCICGVTTTSVGGDTTTTVPMTTSLPAGSTTTLAGPTTTVPATTSTLGSPTTTLSSTTTTLTVSSSSTLAPTTTTLPGTTTTLAASFKRVFVTSTVHDAALGGLAGADAICQARADAAALGGTWTAWLSNSKKSAKDRIGDAEYRLVDGTTVVVYSMADILNGILIHAIDMDELGGHPTPCTSPTQCVWTATFDDGRSDCFGGRKFCCDDWTCNSGGGNSCQNEPAFPATGGQLDLTGYWSDEGAENCAAALHLYCFEN